MEKDLTGEQLARIWMDITDKVRDRKITMEEMDKEIELFMDTYTPMDHNTWVDWVLKLHELEGNRWNHDYYSQRVLALDYQIAFLQQMLKLIVAYIDHEDYITSLHGSIPGFEEAWVKHCKEHPEDKEKEVEQKKRLKEFYEIFDTGVARNALSTMKKERAEITNSDAWDIIGYPKPVSIFAEMEESKERKQ